MRNDQFNTPAAFLKAKNTEVVVVIYMNAETYFDLTILCKSTYMKQILDLKIKRT